MFICYLLVLMMVAVIGGIVYVCCKSVELTESMDLIVIRRLARLKIDRCKKESKIAELKLYKNKENADSIEDKIKIYKFEIGIRDIEIQKLMGYGRL